MAQAALKVDYFQTHEIVNKLTGRGFDVPQAEAIIEIFGLYMAEILVTKADLNRFESKNAKKFADIDKRIDKVELAIDKLRAEQKVAIAELETRMLRWFIVFGIGMTTVIISALVLAVAFLAGSSP